MKFTLYLLRVRKSRVFLEWEDLSIANKGMVVYLTLSYNETLLRVYNKFRIVIDRKR